MSSESESPPGRFSSFQWRSKAPGPALGHPHAPGKRQRGAGPAAAGAQPVQTVPQERRKPSVVPAPRVPALRGASERQDQGASSPGLGSANQHAPRGMPGPNALLPGLSPASTDHTRHV